MTYFVANFLLSHGLIDTYSSSTPIITPIDKMNQPFCMFNCEFLAVERFSLVFDSNKLIKYSGWFLRLNLC